MSNKKEKIQEHIDKQKESIKKVIENTRKRNKKKKMGKLTDRKIKELDIAQMKDKKIMENEGAVVTNPRKITPEIESILFGYYVAGASLRSIHRQFGKEMDFCLKTLLDASKYYLWEDRQRAVRNLVMNDNTLQLAERFKDYATFIDDMISEAMIRFTKNVEESKTSSPFETLKISSPRDLKDMISSLIEISNGGVKKVKIDGKIKLMNDEKASKILEILADDSDEVTDAEFTEVEKKSDE